MNRKGLSKQAAALTDELTMKCPRINMLRGISKEIMGTVGKERLRSDVMHEKTGLMKQIMDLAHV